MATTLAPPPTGVRRLLYRSAVMLALIYLLGLAIRLSNLDGVFTDFGIFPISTDSFYHLRRIHFAVAHGLQVPDVDHYVNFPDGARVNWPFGFDWLYAFVAQATYTLFQGSGRPDEGWTTAVACWLTPLLGAFTPCLGYAIATRLGGVWAGVTAGLILAWLPSLWVVCAVGYVDHHVFESLCTGLYLWAVVREHPANRHGVVAGSALAIGLLCATILPLLVGLHALVTLGIASVPFRAGSPAGAPARQSLGVADASHLAGALCRNPDGRTPRCQPGAHDGLAGWLAGSRGHTDRFGLDDGR